jgi:hypothetical protein
MRTRIDQTSRRYTGGRTKEALTYAVRLVVSQLSNGIDLAEAVQFAAKYHDVTCAAIEAELSKNGSGTLSAGLSGL